MKKLFIKMPFQGLLFWESNLFRRILLIFLFALTLVIAIIYLSIQSVQGLKKNMQWVLHTQQVISAYDGLWSCIQDAETGQRGFLLTSDSAFLKPYIEAQGKIYDRMKVLKTLVNDNPQQQRRLVYLDSLILQKRIFLNRNLITPDYDVQTLYKGRLIMDSIRVIIDHSKMDELRLMDERNSRLEESRRQTKTAITILSIMSLALVLLPLVSSLFELRKRLKVQELLDSVLNTSTSGIQSFLSVRDQRGRIVDFRFIQANEASYRMENNSPGYYTDKTLLQVVPEIKGEGLFEKYVHVVETDTPLNMEHYQQRNGAGKWFHLAAAKLSDGFTLTFEDITREKKNEIVLENNVAELKRTNAELEQFAYVASHDLQEPLRKILAFIDRLQSKPDILLNEESKNYLGRIGSAALRMKNLINDLLGYSRAGNEGAITRIDLNKVLNEVLSDFEVIVQQKQAKIMASDLPVIEGIAIQIQQLFQNLISNSLKFSDSSRSPVITIESEYVNEMGKRIDSMGEVNSRSCCRLYFKDNGIGFEDKYAGKIFQIFQRLHGRDEYEGTGIGLAICNKIVTNHRGTIIAKGKTGGGATFIITLPLRHHRFSRDRNTLKQKSGFADN